MQPISWARSSSPYPAQEVRPCLWLLLACVWQGLRLGATSSPQSLFLAYLSVLLTLASPNFDPSLLTLHKLFRLLRTTSNTPRPFAINHLATSKETHLPPFIPSGESSTYPLTERVFINMSVSIITHSAHIAQLGAPVNTFVSHASFQLPYADVRADATDLEAELSNASQDLTRGGGDLFQMAENTKKIDGKTKRVSRNKEILMHKLSSVSAAGLASNHSITAKNDTSYTAIEKELKETNKELVLCEVDLHKSNTKQLEMSGGIQTLATEQRIADMSYPQRSEQNRKWTDLTPEGQLVSKEQRKEIKKQRDNIEETERMLIATKFAIKNLETKLRRMDENRKGRATKMDKSPSQFMKRDSSHTSKEKCYAESSFAATRKQATSVANETEILGEKLGLAFSRGCSTLLGTPRSCSIILGLPNFLNSPKNSVRAILVLSRHFSVILGVSRWCSAGLVLVSAPRLQHCRPQGTRKPWVVISTRMTPER
jgi:hypothetical protein